MIDVRLLTGADAKDRWDLAALAFGRPDQAMPADYSPVQPGAYAWGAFDGGRLVAMAVDRAQDHYWGGRPVPASGVAAVAVAAERRGGGLARLVLGTLLVHARERGAAISTLFHTTPLVYRQLGYDECGVLSRSAFPTASLARTRVPAGWSLRAASADDRPAIDALFEAYARATNGMMSRSGAPAGIDPLAGCHGLTVAIDPGETIAGYAAWDRSGGYEADGRITVRDLVARDADGYAALLALIGGWQSTAPTTAWTLPERDPAHRGIWTQGLRVERRHPWMLRIVDAVRAVETRGWAPVSGVVDLRIEDAECPWNAGDWRLVLDDGYGRLEPGGSGATVLTARGLALVWSGAGTPDNARRCGLMSGATGGDALLAAAAAGPGPHLHDYF